MIEEGDCWGRSKPSGEFKGGVDRLRSTGLAWTSAPVGL